VLDERFVVLGAAISLVGTSRYVRATLSGRAQPNRVTWACWAVAPLLAFAAEVHEGVGLRSLMTFVIGFSPLLILAASFVNPHAYWRLGPFDVACGVLSLSAVVGWAVTRSGVVAIVFAIGADFIAAVPTVRKTWHHPRTEEPLVFVLGVVNGVITLLTVDHWTTANVAFPAYIVAMGGTLATIVYLRRLPGHVAPRALEADHR